MTRIAILGAGITGLSSGWLLNREGIDFVILEKQPYIGGLARSFEWHGFNCDFAAHRLFTSNESILQQMLNLVPMGRHVRRSRIYLKKHWMRDPLDVIELGLKLSFIERLKAAWSYTNRPQSLPEGNFENYVVRRYGKSLYKYFFQPYTEKLFGIQGDQISVLWARQKVRLANPLDLLRENTKTKFQYFYYPIRGGYGAIADQLYQEIRDQVILESTVTELKTAGGVVSHVIYQRDGEEIKLPVDAVISTLPMSVNAQMLGTNFQLQYQKVDAVYLLVNKPLVSDYHWIYFIDSDISINRLVEFKNMSPVDTPPTRTVLCAEVTQHHKHVINKVCDDLERVGLISRSDILDTKVVHEKYAYPIYNQNYEDVLKEAYEFFSRFKNFHQVGRAAEFRHREADDNFETALQTIQQIKQSIPLAIEKPFEEIPMIEKAKGAQIYAVILTYNHYEDTKECLESLFLSDYEDLKVVIADNGSSDNTPELIRRDFPMVHVIENGQNLGVPAGYNIGFQYALKNGADYILMLNNDTAIPPDMVAKLIEVAENDHNTGIVMPKVIFYGSKDQVWSSGGRYRAFPPAILMTDKRYSADDSARLVEYAPSCGLLIHRRAFERAGLFDPGYFFLFDDWDFSERVRAHGLNIWYAPNAFMWHKVSKTTQGPRSPLYWQTFGASIARFYRRHGRPVWISLPVHIGYIMIREFLWKRNWNYFPDFWHGVLAGLQKPLGSIPAINTYKLSR